jgi:hypothetical protein
MSRRVVRLRDNRFAAGPVMSTRTVRPPPTAAVAPVPPADHLTAGMRAVVAAAGRRQGDRPIREARRPAIGRKIGHLISQEKGGHPIVGCG